MMMTKKICSRMFQTFMVVILVLIILQEKTLVNAEEQKFKVNVQTFKQERFLIKCMEYPLSIKKSTFF